MYQNKG